MNKLEELEQKVDERAENFKKLNKQHKYLERKLNQTLKLLHNSECVKVDKLHEVAEEIILDISDRLDKKNKVVEDKIDKLIEVLNKLL